MISLSKIAGICGVSIATVSKALRDKPGVSPDIRERVQSVARQHNYRPNRLVHALQKGRSMTIGILCSHFGEEFSGNIIDGILEVLTHAHYNALITSWERNIQENNQVLRSFLEHRVDGILMFPPASYPTGSYLEELLAFSNPIVVVDQTWPGCDFDFFGSQDAEGAFTLTEHLITLGHKDIANIHYSHSSTGAARLKGFQKAMIRHGIAVHEKWLREIRVYGSSEPHTLATELLSAHNRPTAIMAFNDLVALQVMAAATDLGIRVPEQLSVTGFADLSFAHNIRPRLTTISQDPASIGRKAAARLLASIKNRDEDSLPGKRHIERLPVELIVRGSSAERPA